MELKEKLVDARKHIIELTYKMGHVGAHVAPSLSLVDILTVLFDRVMDKEDLFVLSKGHGGLGYYVALYEAGIITKEELYTFEDNGGNFPGQPSRNPHNPVIYSSGSLGMGLGYAVGRALATDKQVYVLMGDGESNEGTIWESAMYAGHLQVKNLTAIVDYNRMQSDGASKDILDYDLEKIWDAMRWDVVSCDGHDPEALLAAFEEKTERPKVIVANTVKGKGVSFMENAQEWHHNHLSEKQYQEALAELEGKHV